MELGTSTSDSVLDVGEIPRSDGGRVIRVLRIGIAYLPYLGWYLVAAGLTLYAVASRDALRIPRPCPAREWASSGRSGRHASPTSCWQSPWLFLRRRTS